ncbi:hypothetical protein N8I71_17030 [Roseibacterium sp. SDUM158016]|uniref:hypothetical protein n=1 Tax=Roseicyclus sediminis TaxID=2980997 RepID=UPI0021D01305|nr:hypothetical protein [Roseibacterium sp. SDUM158016]MCU4654545.1 hypothetical protein [Roseibacterium sp. SDUM158016]
MRSILFCLALILASLLPGASLAQEAEVPLFDSYEDMRATLDQLVSERRVGELLSAFGGGDEMSLQDMSSLEMQVRNIYPEDFANTAVMLRAEMAEGFGQELIAYWSGTSYIYVRVLWHELPEGGVLALNMTFNSNPDVLIALF